MMLFCGAVLYGVYNIVKKFSLIFENIAKICKKRTFLYNKTIDLPVEKRYIGKYEIGARI